MSLDDANCTGTLTTSATQRGSQNGVILHQLKIDETCGHSDSELLNLNRLFKLLNRIHIKINKFNSNLVVCLIAAVTHCVLYCKVPI